MDKINIDKITVLAEQTPGQVSFYNFNELKNYMQTGLSVYNSTVYTLENLEQAIEDRQTLREIKKKINNKKKELVASYSMPIEEVKEQLDELLDMIKPPLDSIDKFIKSYEKEKKRQDIMDYAKQQAISLGDYADNVIESDAFFNPRWLNSTYSTKQWKNDVDIIIQNAIFAIHTIQNTGGSDKSALKAFYFNKLSLDGAEKFMQILSEESNESDTLDELQNLPNDDNIIGYKVLKIYGTKRQMLQLMTQLQLSELEVDEIEDGMPLEMSERKDADFDTFVAFDIEHTGTFGISKGDKEPEIIEIGAVKVSNGKIVDRFDMLANPGRKIVPRIARITNISDDMVKNEPPVDDVIKKFKEFVGDNILVGHNIKSCDIPHIVRASKRAGVSFENSFFDTYVFAKSMKQKMDWKNDVV